MSKKYFEEISKFFIDKINENNIPWEKPWDTPPKFPFSAVSGKFYNGTNIFSLLNSASKNENGGFATFNQIRKQGGSVNKGARGIKIVYAFEVEIQKTNKNNEPTKEKQFKIKQYRVFNLNETSFNSIDLHNPQNSTIEDLIKKNNIKINQSSFTGKAYYNPTNDIINMPNKEDFQNEARYNGTVLHEIIHWTGNHKRKDRDFTGGRGTKEYSQEELVAQIGSFLLASQLNLPFEPNSEVGYLKAYTKSFPENEISRIILQAVKDASSAVHFLTNEKELTKLSTLEEFFEKENQKENQKEEQSQENSR